MVANDGAIKCLFGVDNLRFGAETFDVSFPYIGDESVVGACDGAQVGNFARMVGSHLHDGNFIRWLYREQCQRNAYVVVEVALGVGGAEFFCHHSGNQLFGGGLSVGACDADDGDGELLPMVGGQLLQSLQTVLDHYAARVVRQCTVLGDDIRRALVQCRQGKLVAVETLAFETYEYAVRDDVACVGANLRMR